MAVVIQTLSADGQTDSVSLLPYGGRVRAATADVHVYGSTFGSGTVTIQISPDSGTTWYAATDVNGDITFSANGAAKIDYNSLQSAPVLARASLSGSSSPSLNIKWIINE